MLLFTSKRSVQLYHLQKLATTLVGHRDGVPDESIIGITPSLLCSLNGGSRQVLFVLKQLVVDPFVDRVIGCREELVEWSSSTNCPHFEFLHLQQLLEAGERLHNVWDRQEGDELGRVSRVDGDAAEEADEEDDPGGKRLGVKPGALGHPGAPDDEH